jgi:serine/threonine-protein kinase
MENPADSRLSQIETLAGAAAARVAGREAPDFPVKDWDRYECLGFLGQGGMGMVFLARDRKLGREVAIKFVRVEDARHVARFLAEARAQARVDHEHVCKVYEVGEIEGRVFITMQRIAGASLEAAAAELSLEQKAVALRDAARGVHEAHRMGIIHRDLKPSNLMVERGGDGTLRTFVMDFGLAHEWNRDLTETGSVLGTPAYMSPEQARGEVSTLDRRTDVYSLGATLYHLAAGRPPVQGANALEVLSAIATDEVPSPRSLGLDLPRDLEAIALKCLEKERAKRYDSAKALADDLDRFLGGEPVQARSTGLWYRLQRRLRKHRNLVLAGGAALVLVMAALGAALKARRDAGTRERLAQQFTEAMGRIESLARYSALAPLHDIRTDLQEVRRRMDRLREDMERAGRMGEGPGHYALGRGYWTLDDAEKAREHLQKAWDAGFREPRAAYALAVALGRQYQERLLEAERLRSADQRAARKRDLVEKLRAPALALLQQARGADAPSPAYLEALRATYEGRADEAIELLREVERGLPWFYEAPLLRGSLLQARAWSRWNQGDREGAHGDFAAGRGALAAAAASGRSAPATHAALAELELNALVMEKYGQGQVEPAFERGMAAVQAALAAQPDHVPSLILESTLLGHLADFRASRGEAADDLAQRSVATAQQAVDADPARSGAWVALGMAYYQWGNARHERNLEAVDQLARGLRALEVLSLEQRDYRVENHIGLIRQTWAEVETEHGRDPAVQLDGAISAYRRATELESTLLPAWINLATCLQQRAGRPGATDPEGDLQGALKVLKRAQELNPRHFVPYFVEGEVRCGLARRARSRGADPGPLLALAIEALQKGLAINPAVPQLHNALGIAELERARHAWAVGGNSAPSLATAEAAFRRAMAIAPSQVFGGLNLSDLLIQRARWEGGPKAASALGDAERLLDRALVGMPTHPGLLANLGGVQAARVDLALREGQGPGAAAERGEAALKKALAVDARSREAWQYLGEIRAARARWKAQRGMPAGADYDGAEDALSRAAALDPGAPDLCLAQARLCLWRADSKTEGGRGLGLERAKLLVEAVLGADPANPEALVLKGALALAVAEGLPADQRAKGAGEALACLSQAMALNRNLAREWRGSLDRARRLKEAPSR